MADASAVRDRRQATKRESIRAAPGRFGSQYGITPDWLSIPDRWSGLCRANLAVGISGDGFKLSPLVGELMVELLREGRAKTLDITPLPLARFTENDTLQTQNSYGVRG